MKLSRWGLLASVVAIGVSGCFSRPTDTFLKPSLDIDARRRIAILPFESKHGDGQAMADAFVTEFMSAGFTVVDRGLLEGAGRSLNINVQGGVLEPEELTKLAAKLRLHGVVFGTLNAEPERQGGEVRSVSLRMVDADNGEVILSSTFKNEKTLPAFQIPNEMMSHIFKRVKKAVKAKKRQEKKRAQAEAKLKQLKAAEKAAKEKDKDEE